MCEGEGVVVGFGGVGFLGGWSELFSWGWRLIIYVQELCMGF